MTFDHKTYNRERYQKLRDKYIDLLGGVCINCGATSQLEFDHIDSSSKTLDISKLLNYAQSRVLEELPKCQLLCKPCHLVKTKLNGDNTGGEHNRIDYDQAQHGTSIMYHKFKCKCEECREFKRQSRRHSLSGKALVL